MFQRTAKVLKHLASQTFDFFKKRIKNLFRGGSSPALLKRLVNIYIMLVLKTQKKI